jgi:hypothetical protein
MFPKIVDVNVERLLLRLDPDHPPTGAASLAPKAGEPPRLIWADQGRSAMVILPLSAPADAGAEGAGGRLWGSAVFGQRLGPEARRDPRRAGSIVERVAAGAVGLAREALGAVLGLSEAHRCLGPPPPVQTTFFGGQLSLQSLRPAALDFIRRPGAGPDFIKSSQGNPLL